jgi:molybdopterin-guanine dinucleotide biosynthesis protein A
MERVRPGRTGTYDLAMAKSIPSSKILGGVLAGGRSSRMGGVEKAMVELGGRPLLAHVVDRLRPQAGAHIVISANDDPRRFAAFGLPVVPDTVETFAGPLAGILAAMNWAREHAPDAEFVATAAVDTPFFPQDLVARLSAALDTGHDLAVAQSRGRLHPVFGLFAIGLADDLAGFLGDARNRAAIAWIERHRSAVVSFDGPDRRAIDPFFNINTPDDLDMAERLTQSGILRRPCQ